MIVNIVVIFVMAACNLVTTDVSEEDSPVMCVAVETVGGE